MVIRRFALLSIAVAASCSPQSSPPPIAAKPPPKQASPTAAPGVRWALARGLVSRRVRLSESETLLLGVRGERWSVGADGKVDRSAEDVADEPLLGAQRVDGAIRFVGERGTIWTAKASLGPLEHRTAPPHAFAAVGVGRRAIVALRGTDVLRTVDGVTWSKVAVPVDDSDPLQVAMRGDGAGLLLFGPGRLLATTDDGATWSPIASPTRGLEQVSSANGDDLWVEGWIDKARLEGDPPTLVPFSSYALVPPFGADPFASRGSLWHASRAWNAGAFVGRRWLELVPEGAGSVLYGEEFGLFGKEAVVGRVEGCFDGSMAAAASRVAVACTREDDATAKKLRLVESGDGGKTFRETALVGLAGAPYARRIWVSADGVVLVRGACATPGAACTTRVVRSEDGASVDVAFDAPDATIESVTFLDAERVIGVGTLGKDTTAGPAFFRSNDGGRSFVHVALPPDPRPGKDHRGAAAIGVEAGAVRAVAIAHAGKWSLYGTSDGGATWSLRRLPTGTAHVAIVGRRVLAKDFDGRFHESADAGERWGSPPAPYAGDGALACFEGGCWIGTDAARVGWSLGGPGGAPLEPERPDVVPATPMRCTVEAGWNDVANLPSDGGTTLHAKGDVRWTAVAQEYSERGAAVVVARTSSASEGFTYSRVELFPKSVVRVAVYRDAIGYVAVSRPPRDEDAWFGEPKKSKPHPATFDAEVAAWDAATGKVTRTKVPKVPWRADLDVLGRDPAGLLIAIGDELAVLGPGGKIVDRRPKIPTDALPHLYGYRLSRHGSEWRAHGAMNMDGHAFAAWSPGPGKPWVTELVPVWPGSGRWKDRVEVSPIFFDGEPYHVVVHGGRESDVGAFIAPSPVAPGEPAKRIARVPLLTELGDPPPPCAADASSWPTVVVQGRDAPHPILVQVDGEEVLLKSGRVRLAVSKGGRACVRGFEAWTVDSSRLWRADLELDALDHAALFGDIKKGARAVASMSCAWAPDAFGPTDPRWPTFVARWL